MPFLHSGSLQSGGWLEGTAFPPPPHPRAGAGGRRAVPRLRPGEGVGDGRPRLDPLGGGAPQLAVPGGAATEAVGARDPPPAAVRAATSAGGCVRGGGRGAAPRPGWRGRKMAAGIREKQTGKRLPARGAARSGGCPSRSCGEGRRVGLTLRPGAPACFPPCRPPALSFGGAPGRDVGVSAPPRLRRGIRALSPGSGRPATGRRPSPSSYRGGRWGAAQLPPQRRARGSGAPGASGRSSCRGGPAPPWCPSPGRRRRAWAPGTWHQVPPWCGNRPPGRGWRGPGR